MQLLPDLRHPEHRLIKLNNRLFEHPVFAKVKRIESVHMKMLKVVKLKKNTDGQWPKVSCL
jgi:hypothetical protein